MVKARIILSAALTASLLFCSGTALRAQTSDVPAISWKRVAMDGHRTPDKAHLSGTPASEQALVESCRPQMGSLNEVVGYAPVAMEKAYPQSTLTNWVSDLLLEESGKYFGERADICIHNFGGVRVDMPKGDIIVNDIRSMFPFNNKLTLVKLSGKRLLEIFEGMAGNAFECFAGVKAVADKGHIVSLEVGGQPVQEDKTYSLVTNDFLLHGGDSLTLGENVISVTRADVTFYDVVMAHLADLRAQGKPVEGVVDDRLIILSPKPGSRVKVSETEKFNTTNPVVAHPRLTIIHTNDTHSNIEPIRAGEYAGWAGVVERAAYVDSVRRADGKRNVLLLDAGDFSQGTPYFSIFKGTVEVEAMNRMKYDASTIGNHEWDNGIDALAWRLKMMKFRPVLCNYEFDNADLNRYIRPYTIVRRGGMKIGIIGVLTNVTTSVDRKVADRLKYLDPAEPVTRYADYLKNVKKCDLVVVLSHAGISAKPGESAGDMQFIPKIRNVDIVIGGHTHTDLRTPIWLDDSEGRKVMLVTDYKWGIYVGEIKL